MCKPDILHTPYAVSAWLNRISMLRNNSLATARRPNATSGTASVIGFGFGVIHVNLSCRLIDLTAEIFSATMASGRALRDRFPPA
jgi:hypothetical protein